MDFVLKINMDNSAFEDGSELVQILLHLADRMKRSMQTIGQEYRVLDSNGNTVGEAKFVN